MEAGGMDIIDGVFALPPMSLAGSEPDDAGLALEAERSVRLIREARHDVERRALGNDAIAAATLRLGPQWRDADLAALGADVAAQSAVPAREPARVESAAGDTARVARIFYDTAGTAFGTGRLAQSAALLATVLHLGAGEADALVGLAACAARMEKFDEALILATECTRLPVKHPRAFSIAGFCELERGNRKAAQSLLALAARMARNRPDLRQDLRTAQRLLLILHFA